MSAATVSLSAVVGLCASTGSVINQDASPSPERSSEAGGGGFRVNAGGLVVDSAVLKECKLVQYSSQCRIRVRTGEFRKVSQNELSLKPKRGKVPVMM